MPFRTPLGCFNFTHRKLRTLSALCGVSTAVMLIFLQFGLYRGGCQGAVMLLEQFDYDLVILPNEYRFIGNSATVDRERIHQALAAEEVERTAPFFLGEAKWLDVEAEVKREVLVVGVDPAAHPFRMPQVNRLLPGITRLDTALVDRKRGKGFARLVASRTAEFSGHKLDLVGEYEHGIGILGDAAIIASDQTFSRVVGGTDTTLTRMTLGFVWLKPEVAPDRALQVLGRILPPDVQVMKRADHLKLEERFLMHQKPVGVMFITGLWLSLIVGAVILYQILSTDIENRISEFATLKAMGYGMLRIYAVVWQQALLFACCGYLPALASGTVLYHMINTTTTVPAIMDGQAMGTVLSLTLIMCFMAASLAMRKINRADPADLFS